MSNEEKLTQDVGRLLLEIDRLKEENERLRNALSEIANNLGKIDESLRKFILSHLTQDSQWGNITYSNDPEGFEDYIDVWPMKYHVYPCALCGELITLDESDEHMLKVHNHEP